MDNSVSTLMWGIVWGSIGFGYFIYGRKQKAVIPFLCGIALMVLPYLISSALLLFIVCIAVMFIPYYIKI
ncbi:MAG: hypothetical protein D6B27_09410 [Gammaproteobacteria bacterium]|nr:MAG: hypothetical protein D6B27_09410 [Gammaproteobacteria bacterium]